MNVTIPFTKMVGTGNDFIVVDTLHHPLPALKGEWPEVTRALCERHTAIGADGILVLEPSASANVKMRVFNPDGSEAEMCGNGARCVALYVKSKRRGREQPVTIETAAGVLEATVRDNCVAIRMTDPTALQLELDLDVDNRRIRLGSVNTGVPHAVVSVERLEEVDVVGLGRTLRHHHTFAPQGTNVNFIQADTDHPDRLRVRTYERGVEEETRSCGTGLAASAMVYALSRGSRSSHHRGDCGVPGAVGDRPAAGQGASGNGGRQHCRLEVQPRSGDVLSVSFAVSSEGSDLRVTDVVLEGLAVRVFDGTVSWPLRRTE